MIKYFRGQLSWNVHSSQQTTLNLIYDKFSESTTFRVSPLTMQPVFVYYEVSPFTFWLLCESVCRRNLCCSCLCRNKLDSVDEKVRWSCSVELDLVSL